MITHIHLILKVNNMLLPMRQNLGAKEGAMRDIRIFETIPKKEEERSEVFILKDIHCLFTVNPNEFDDLNMVPGVHTWSSDTTNLTRALVKFSLVKDRRAWLFMPTT